MSDARNNTDGQDESEALKKHGAAQPRKATPPSYAARLFAVVLLIVIAPSLLFTGYVGIKFPSFGVILLPAFGIITFVAYKGSRALWFVHKSPQSGAWAVALAVLAVLLFSATRGLLHSSRWLFELRRPSYQYRRRAGRAGFIAVHARLRAS
jgi:hypothetical protein